MGLHQEPNWQLHEPIRPSLSDTAELYVVSTHTNVMTQTALFTVKSNSYGRGPPFHPVQSRAQSKQKIIHWLGLTAFHSLKYFCRLLNFNWITAWFYYTLVKIMHRLSPPRKFKLRFLLGLFKLDKVTLVICLLKIKTVNKHQIFPFPFLCAFKGRVHSKINIFWKCTYC